MILQMNWHINTLGNKGNNSYLKRLQIRQAVKARDGQSTHEHIYKCLCFATVPFKVPLPFFVNRT